MEIVDEVPAVDIDRENEKLRKIVKALVGRVERSTDAQGNAFSLFQAAITLENTVRQRTLELQTLNDQLQQEIEDRRAIEAALERAKQHAERANLGKTEFLRAASHDLLQPLNVARLILAALGERGHDAESKAMLDRVVRSLESADSLLSTLLEMSRIDAGALTPALADVAVDPLLKMLSSDYALEADERRLRLRFVPSNAVARTDIRLLERILRNFLSNALRYTSRGGVLVGCRVRGSRLHVEVWDTGRGIPPDRLDDVFREFSRVDEVEGDSGMGLGLAIVDRLAGLLDGRVSVRSRVGLGSVFAIDIPLGDVARSRAAAAPRRASDAIASLLSGKIALLVDDDAAHRTMLAARMRAWGLVVVEAATVEESLVRVREVDVTPSVLVANCGGDPHVEREAGSAAIPTVFLTADANERTPDSPACWYLERPVRVERLRSLLNHVLRV